MKNRLGVGLQKFCMNPNNDGANSGSSPGLTAVSPVSPAAHLLKDGIDAYVQRDDLEDTVFRDLLTFMMED